MKTLFMKLWLGYNNLCTHLPQALVLLLCRLAIGSVFWRSAQTKISGWEFLGQSWKFFNLGESTFALFKFDYNLPLIPSDIAAYAGTTVEFFMPLLLLIGLGTRAAALGLFIMTSTIQIFVFPDAWPTHILWFALLLTLLRQGGGKLSVDSMMNLM